MLHHVAKRYYASWVSVKFSSLYLYGYMLLIHLLLACGFDKGESRSLSFTYEALRHLPVFDNRMFQLIENLVAFHTTCIPYSVNSAHFVRMGGTLTTFRSDPLRIARLERAVARRSFFGNPSSSQIIRFA
jgi:hypothetical protein